MSEETWIGTYNLDPSTIIVRNQLIIHIQPGLSYPRPGVFPLSRAQQLLIRCERHGRYLFLEKLSLVI